MSMLMEAPAVEQAQLQGLLERSSLEMTAKDAGSLEAAAAAVPQGTAVSLTFLPNESLPARVAAAAQIRRLGLVPIPHLSARRMKSRQELDDYVGQLVRAAAVDRVFVIAGDPPQPEGPFADALAIIRSGVLERHGIRHVGIAGYPEGHPGIPEQQLWQAMRDKQAALGQLGLGFDIVTQFGFDAQPVLAWLGRLRREGVDAPVRVGVAGPADVKTLLRYAARCGVGTSAKIMAKYGLSLTHLFGSAGPERVIRDLASGLNPSVHGKVSLHFYPFGGLARTAQWVRDFRGASGS